MTILLDTPTLALYLAFIGHPPLLLAIKNNQYDDLKGAAERILIDEDDR